MPSFVTPPNFVAGAVLTEAQLDILSENETFLANPPKCRVFNSAAISVPNGAGTALTFDSERFDTDTMHSTTVNTSRITFTTAGTYLISAHVGFAANATGGRALDLRVNGVTLVGTNLVRAADTNDTFLSVAAMWAVAAGDYAEAVAFQTSGAALNIVAAAARSPEFSAVWVSL